MRTLLKLADRVVGSMATQVLADSRSQQIFLESQGIVRPGKCQVLGAGSITGVDLDRFRARRRAESLGQARSGIPDDASWSCF